jgi:hypothetical protein
MLRSATGGEEPARKLCDRDMSFYLPLLRAKWCNRGQRFNSYLPLFPSYLFAAIAVPQDRFETNCRPRNPSKMGTTHLRLGTVTTCFRPVP